VKALEPLSENLSQRVAMAILAAAVLASVAGGVFLLVRTSDSSGGIEIVLPTATAVAPPDIKVYITGAVRSPGVYDVAEDSRLVDVLEAAGGATDDTDLAAVNLASRISDEQHFHVPTVGETVQEAPAQPQPPVASGASGKINLNSADVGALATLPNIGDVRAKAIVSYREANGPFPDVDAVLGVSGIGPATLEAIRDLVEAR
jgi:competence protein ComEA